MRCADLIEPNVVTGLARITGRLHAAGAMGYKKLYREVRSAVRLLSAVGLAFSEGDICCDDPACR